MNSMERIGAAIAGERPDRPPFALTLSLYGARLSGAACAEYYADPVLYAAGQRAVVDLCEPDALFGPFAFALEAAAFGAVVEQPADGPPTVRKPAFPPSIDRTTVRRPDPESGPYLRYLVDSVKAVVEDQHGSRPVAAPIVAPTDLPALLIGMDAWIEALLFDPEAAAFWSRLAIEHFGALAAAYFKAGAAFLVAPVMLANPAVMPRKMTQGTAIPILAEAFSRLPGPIVFHHGGNRIASCLEDFAALPNVVGFAMDEKDSLAVSRRTLGDGPLLLGNLSGPHFSRRSPKDLADRASRLFRDREADSRYILASSGADIPFDTDPDCVAAIRRAAEAAP